MGRKINLTHLSEDECEKILHVLQKDFALRQREEDRINVIEEYSGVKKEKEKTKVLSKETEFNNKTCIRCLKPFGLIFNRKQKCMDCFYNVCKFCSEYDTYNKSYVCTVCIKQRDIKDKSCEWFYTSVGKKFHRFGSAKVVQSLYKRKAESDVEFDSGYFQLSGSLSIEDKHISLSQENLSHPDGLLVEEAGVSRENHRVATSTCQLSNIITLNCDTVGVRVVEDMHTIDMQYASELDNFSVPNTKKPKEKTISRATSLETLIAPKSLYKSSSLTNIQSATDEPDFVTRRSLTSSNNDIYKESSDITKKAEEQKFKLRFNHLVSELHRALENQTPPEMDASSNHTSYGEIMVDYRNRFKEVLTGISKKMQQSMDMKQHVSKLVENSLGESIDLNSDEAVSDLSSLSDDSENQRSFEDQLAQAVVAKVMENHRQEFLNQSKIDVNNSQDHSTHIASRTSTPVPVDLAIPKGPMAEEFMKLKKIAEQSPTRSRPVISKSFDEKIEAKEDKIKPVSVDKKSHQDDFLTKCSTYDHALSHRAPLPDFDAFADDDDYGMDSEVDPDMLSINLASIPEESESDLVDYNMGYSSNWIFQRPSSLSAYENCNERSIRSKDVDDDPYYMMIPETADAPLPRVGNREISDLPDEDNDDEFSDTEMCFENNEDVPTATSPFSDTDYTSSLRSSENVSSHTDITLPKSDTADSIQSLSELDMEKTQEMTSSVGSEVQKTEDLTVKLTEESIPSENDDPKFRIPPESANTQEGVPVIFSCRVSGTQPIDVFWYSVDKEELTELKDSEKYELANDQDKYTLTIHKPCKSDAGQYMCMALNENGQCCQYMILNIEENRLDFKVPEFLKDLQDAEVREGQSLKLRCKVKGYPPPRVMWYKEGKPLKANQLYKLEKFGNRDYLLVIDSATVDDDAEYSVIVENIAGSIVSSAQVLVEPPEPLPKSPPPVTSQPSENQSVPLVDKKAENHLINLNRKLNSTRDEMVDEAEDMMATADRLCNLHKHLDVVDNKLSGMECTSESDITNNNASLDFHIEAVENYRVMKDTARKVREVTSSALTIIQSAEDVINSEKEALESPRSVTENNSRNSQEGNVGKLPQNDSKSVQYKTISDSKNTLTGSSDIGRTDRIRQYPKPVVTSSEPMNYDEIFDADSSSRLDSVSSQREVVNLGPKKLDPEKYKRDYVVNTSPKPDKRKHWSVNTDTGIPIKHSNVTTEHDIRDTEEKIYMTASKVSSLQHKVQDLESDVSKSRNMAHLEDEVAKTVAQVEQGEKQVKDIEKKVTVLQHSSSKRSHSPQKPPRQSLAPVKKEKPLPVVLVGTSNENDVPESSAEFNTDSGIELPSVNRLRAMFNQSKADKMDSSSLKRVCSITARTVPKEQLEKIKKGYGQSAAAPVRVADNLEARPTHLESSEESDVQQPAGRKIVRTDVRQIFKTDSREANGSVPSTNVFTKSMPNKITTLRTSSSSQVSSQTQPVSPTESVGSISARAALWENRIRKGSTND